jgi:hypothetical protein
VREEQAASCAPVANSIEYFFALSNLVPIVELLVAEEVRAGAGRRSPSCLYNFATYASYREEWAIEASDIDDARSKIGTDPRGSWRNHAIHIDGDTQDRHVFYFGLDIS